MRAMTSTLALILGVTLSSSAFAQDTLQADIDAMTIAIQDAGCLVTAENGDAVLGASGLEENATMAVIEAMYRSGIVSLEADGSMKLTNEVCP